MTDCGFRGWGNTDCEHGEDVQLLCTVPKRPPPPPPAPDRSPPAANDDEWDFDSMQMGILLGGSAVLLCLGVAALGTACFFITSRRADPRKEVHITLHAPGVLQAAEGDGGESAGRDSEAQRALAAALGKALASCE